VSESNTNPLEIACLADVEREIFVEITSSVARIDLLARGYGKRGAHPLSRTGSVGVRLVVTIRTAVIRG